MAHLKQSGMQNKHRFGLDRSPQASGIIATWQPNLPLPLAPTITHITTQQHTVHVIYGRVGQNITPGTQGPVEVHVGFSLSDLPDEVQTVGVCGFSRSHFFVRQTCLQT